LFSPEETAMRQPSIRSEYRLVYRPQPDRMPRWLHQLLAWL
jgi:hypothetical protein